MIHLFRSPDGLVKLLQFTKQAVLEVRYRVGVPLDHRILLVEQIGHKQTVQLHHSLILTQIEGLPVLLERSEHVLLREKSLLWWRGNS
jgi:hypothetical protein